MQISIREVTAHLIEKGWAEIVVDESDSLLATARVWGIPVPSRLGKSLVDKLVPTPAERAHPKSMSAAFGMRSFPFHTDSANRVVPPRFVVLRMKRGFESGIATLIADFRNLNLSGNELELIKREVWVFADANNSCSKRRFAAKDGSFIDEAKGGAGTVFAHFVRSDIRSARRLGSLRGRPNLQKAVSDRQLPGDVLGELLSLKKSLVG
jgi:hypothetical protein